MSRQSELAQLGRVFDTGPLSNRNLIINGAMQVAQRGTSATGVTTSGYKALDRFDIDLSSAGTWTISQDTNTPSGFGSSMKFLCTSADASLGSSDRIAFRQKLEGYNLQGIKKGTSDAQSVAVSFYVKSNKTGTYILEFYDLDNSRHINKAYTVNTADTWEYKTITFDADTTGSFGNDPNASAQLHFWLGAGSNYTSGTLQTSWGAGVAANRAVGNVNLADAASNYWQITGVQLEVGDTATPFEHRSYGDELARCQRYFYKTQTGGGTGEYRYGILDGATGNYVAAFLDFPTPMRAVPSGTQTENGGFYYNTGSGQTSFTPSGGTDDTLGLTETYGRIRQANITNSPGSSNSQKLGQWYCAGEFDAEL